MKFICEIEMGNRAFEEDPTMELHRILRCVESNVADGRTTGRCFDINGNRVGAYEVIDDPRSALSTIDAAVALVKAVASNDPQAQSLAEKALVIAMRRP